MISPLFSTPDNVMVAHVPVKAGVRTVYARIGDAFGWACVAALAVGIGLFALRAIQ